MDVSVLTKSSRPSPFTSTSRYGKLRVVNAEKVCSDDANEMPDAQNGRHSPWLHRSLEPQAVLQAPQWLALAWVLTHAPPHEVTQPVVQMPLIVHRPRSLGLAEPHTAQVGPHASG